MHIARAAAGGEATDHAVQGVRATEIRMLYARQPRSVKSLSNLLFGQHVSDEAEVRRFRVHT